MRNPKRFGCAVALAMFGVFLLWPPFYMQGATRGTVVDARTGAPLSNVAVLARWKVYAAPFGVCLIFRVRETVTGTDGRFVIPAWFQMRWPPHAYLAEADPELFFYKYGYRLLRVNNDDAHLNVIGIPGHEGIDVWVPVTHGAQTVEYSGWEHTGMKRYSFWNGKVIGVIPTPSPEEDAHALCLIQDFAHYSTPKMARAFRDALPRVPASALARCPQLAAYRTSDQNQ